MAEPASFAGAGWAIAPPVPPPRIWPEERNPPSHPPGDAANAPGNEPDEISRAFPEAAANERRDRNEKKHGPESEASAAEQSTPITSESARRAYNREYMRAWRRRHLERYREANRAYQRKAALRRKLRDTAAAEGRKETMCWYRCGRPATGTVERIDPRTWKPCRVPYCGIC